MDHPHTSQTDAQRAAADGRVVVYHRAGCGFCQRLMRTIGDRRGEVVWVDVWADEDASAFVRSVNNGNEVVPTVVMNGIAVTNPDPAVVVDALDAAR